MVVLDSSAILALLNGEPGGEQVARHIGAAMVCTPNVTEVVSKLIDAGDSADSAVMRFGKLPLVVVAFDYDMALRAGALRARTAKQGLSLADRACLALAEREAVPAVTADKAWAKADVAAKLQLIR